MQTSSDIASEVESRAGSHVAKPLPDYPLRPTSFVASLCVHGSIIAGLAFLSAIDVTPSARPVYDEFIKPHEQHIRFYDFRQIPEVAPQNKAEHLETPRGRERSKQIVIATSPKPKSTQQFITVPAPVIEIHQDIPVPMMVAKLDTKVAPPPEQPKPRNFVPPPPAKREPALPIPTPVVAAPAIAMTVSAPPPPVPSLSLAAVPAPPRPAPEAPTASAGNANADVAVASLHATENLEATVPNGSRPAEFSKAPSIGPTTRGGTSAAVVVPDLTIKQPKAEEIPPLPTHQILYADIVRNIPSATLSAPLRPSSRSIPQNLNTRFTGRNVYTMVIAMENLVEYSGDWILWFADRQEKPGGTPLVRAPVPLRKLEVIDHAPPSGRMGARIQIAAVLHKNGKLDGVTFLTDTAPGVQRAVLQDVTAWEFQPATRDGASLEVDVVLEIPFSLPMAIAKGAL